MQGDDFKKAEEAQICKVTYRKGFRQARMRLSLGTKTRKTPQHGGVVPVEIPVLLAESEIAIFLSVWYTK